MTRRSWREECKQCRGRSWREEHKQHRGGAGGRNINDREELEGGM